MIKIILIVYLPIMALGGIEGKMFKPMAQTVAFALLGAFILSLTYIPMMSALFLNKNISHKKNISDKIFDPFFTTKDSNAGSGFGLYNCKLFVEDHKGTIGFNSKPGKGTSFFFYLPLDPRRDDQ